MKLGWIFLRIGPTKCEKHCRGVVTATKPWCSFPEVVSTTCAQPCTRTSSLAFSSPAAESILEVGSLGVVFGRVRGCWGRLLLCWGARKKEKTRLPLPPTNRRHLREGTWKLIKIYFLLKPPRTTGAWRMALFDQSEVRSLLAATHRSKARQGAHWIPPSNSE